MGAPTTAEVNLNHEPVNIPLNRQRRTSTETSDGTTVSIAQLHALLSEKLPWVLFQNPAQGLILHLSQLLNTQLSTEDSEAIYGLLRDYYKEELYADNHNYFTERYPDNSRLAQMELPIENGSGTIIGTQYRVVEESQIEKEQKEGWRVICWINPPDHS